MTLRMLAGAALLISPVAAAAMPVSTFLAKADALKKKGPLAMFSGDLKLLVRQVKTDASALRAENKAAEAAGRRKPYCPPSDGVKMGQNEVLEAMHAVPATQRGSTDTRDALRAYLADRHPCPES